jgi:hypothetical protein
MAQRQTMSLVGWLPIRWKTPNPAVNHRLDAACLDDV